MQGCYSLLSHQAEHHVLVLQVCSISPDPSGQWLASASDDGTVRLWEVRTGRCSRTWKLGGPVKSVAWCPNTALSLLAAAVDSKVVLIPTGQLTGSLFVDMRGGLALNLHSVCKLVCTQKATMHAEP